MEVRLPKFGVSMEEAYVTQWYKQEGEAIEKGEPLAELETDKVQTDFECPVAGTVAKLVAELDEPVKVGDVLAIVEEG